MSPFNLSIISVGVFLGARQRACSASIRTQRGTSLPPAGPAGRRRYPVNGLHSGQHLRVDLCAWGLLLMQDVVWYTVHICQT